MTSESAKRRRRMQLVFPADPVADAILQYIDSFPGGKSAHRAFAVLDLVRRGWASLQAAEGATSAPPMRPAVASEAALPARASGLGGVDVPQMTTADRPTKVEFQDNKRDNAFQDAVVAAGGSAATDHVASAGVKSVLRGLMNGGPQSQ